MREKICRAAGSGSGRRLAFGRRALLFGFLDKVRIEEQNVVSKANFGPAIAHETLAVATRALRRLDLMTVECADYQAAIVGNVQLQLSKRPFEAQLPGLGFSE